MLTKEQWEERKKYIGGSDAAGVLGLSRWSTPLNIWAQKTGQIQYSEEQTIPQWVGSELEEIVAKRFCIETQKAVIKPDDIFYHSKYHFIASQLDRLVINENAAVECKTATAFKAKEWEEEIPTEYLIQAHHELACSKLDKIYVACLIGNHKFVIKEVEYDQHIIDNLIQKEVAFWETYIEPKVMPGQISYLDSDVLYQLFPTPEPESLIELDDEVNIICEDIEAMKLDQLSLEGRIERQKNILKAKLGETEAGSTGRWRVTWKEETKKEHIKPAWKGRVLRTKKLEEETNGEK